MKKFILGLVVGLMVAIPVGAHADIVNMIGKVVDGAFPVKVNGKTIENQAVVIEGTSYLPVRAVGDALNMDVGFDADLGITLNSKVGVAVTSATYDPDTIMVNGIAMNPSDLPQDFNTFDTQKKINWVNDEIAAVKNDVWFLNGSLTDEKTSENLLPDVKTTMQNKLTYDNKRLDFLNGLLAQLQGQ